MKHVQACLSARKGREINFLQRGVPATLVYACFMCGKDLITPFKPQRRCCEARAALFKCQRKSIKLFSPLWRPCEVGASLFMCEKDLITPF